MKPPSDEPSLELRDHFESPRNAGVREDADVHVEVENPVCGDLLHLWVKLDGSGARVSAARFQVYGCPAAIAAGSVTTELIRGRSRDELASLGSDEIAAALGGLEARRAHAAELAADAVRGAAARWSGAR